MQAEARWRRRAQPDLAELDPTVWETEGNLFGQRRPFLIPVEVLAISDESTSGEGEFFGSTKAPKQWFVRKNES